MKRGDFLIFASILFTWAIGIIEINWFEIAESVWVYMGV